MNPKAMVALFRGGGSSPKADDGECVLWVCSGDGVGRRYPLTDDEVILGRAASCAITIDDELVSQRHARVVKEGGSRYVYDLGSSNGTYLNNERIDEAELRDGDVLQVGETVFQYLEASHKEAPPQAEAREGLDLTVRDKGIPKRLAENAQWRMQKARSESVTGIAVPSSGERLPTGSVIDVPKPVEPRFMPPAYVPDAGDDDEDLSLYEVVQHIRRAIMFFLPYWKGIGAITVAFAVLGVVSFFVSPPPRKAIFEVSLVQSAADNPVHRFERSNVSFFASAESNFKSPTLIEKTLKALGEPAPSPGRIAMVQANLEFSSLGPPTPNTYRGSFQSEDPEDAIRFLESHVRLYLETEIEKTLKVIRVESDFLSQQLADTEKELRRTESELLRFKKENIDGLPEQARQYYDYLFELQRAKSEASTQVSRIQAELDLDRNRIQGEAPLVESRVTATRPYQQALVEVNQQLAAARGEGKGDDHPDMVRLMKQAEELKRMAEVASTADETSIEKRRNPVYDSVQSNLHRLEVSERVARKEAGRIERDLSRVKGVVEKLPELEATYADLTRSYDATKALHTRIFEQLKTTQLQLELERASAAARYDIITPPSLEFVSPVRKMVGRTIPAAVLGFFVGLIYATVMRFRSSHDGNLQGSLS